MSETLGNVVKTGLSVFIASFPGELFILKLFHFFHFRTLCGRIWVFCLKTSARLSKLRFTAPSGLFDEKMFCRLKILFLNVFWHFIKNIGFTAEIFGQCCQNCIVRVYWNIFRRKVYSETVLLFFTLYPLSVKIWAFVKKLLDMVFKNAL